MSKKASALDLETKADVEQELERGTFCKAVFLWFHFSNAHENAAIDPCFLCCTAVLILTLMSLKFGYSFLHCFSDTGSC